MFWCLILFITLFIRTFEVGGHDYTWYQAENLDGGRRDNQITIREDSNGAAAEFHCTSLTEPEIGCPVMTKCDHSIFEIYEGHSYKIQSNNDDFALHAAYSGAGDNELSVLYHNRDHPDQKWKFVAKDNGYKIINPRRGYALEQLGTISKMKPVSNSNAQLWKLSMVPCKKGRYLLENVASGKLLTWEHTTLSSDIKMVAKNANNEYCWWHVVKI